MPYYVYILSNKAGSVLITGITGELVGRTLQHREKHDPSSFTAKYNVSRLVYFEEFEDVRDAIAREKQIKGGSRARKLALINAMNLEWNDLYDELADKGLRRSAFRFAFLQQVNVRPYDDGRCVRGCFVVGSLLAMTN